jgi:hypothetical protein
MRDKRLWLSDGGDISESKTEQFPCRIVKYKVQRYIYRHILYMPVIQSAAQPNSRDAHASNLYLTPPPRPHRRSSISLLWFFMASL